MQCPECKQATLVRVEGVPTQEVGRLLGLRSVTLIGAPGLKCEGCKTVLVPGEIIDSLLPALAAQMAQVSDLGADEARFLRKTLGLTQSELADTLQISRATVARWESDDGGLRGADSYALRALVGTHFIDLNRDVAEEIFASLKRAPRGGPPPSYRWEPAAISA